MDIVHVFGTFKKFISLQGNYFKKGGTKNMDTVHVFGTFTFHYKVTISK